MTFDQATRNRLSSFVGEARSLLSEEFTRQLKQDYGLDPDLGEVTELDKLGHLDDARLETARILRDTLAHYEARLPSQDAKTRVEALQRIVREQAFTVLNRLCALRMAEARGLLIVSIARGYQSDGFQLYTRLAGISLGEISDAYRSYLFSIFDEFAVDLPVLFDRFSPQGRLFPREAVLTQLLDAINHTEMDSVWAEDETIGWIYQYFNSSEERRQMRAESSVPRNSRELAIRNQFFTPRYVVEFLTDNTLGRIWYEMRKGDTVLTNDCRYLVRRPNEVFLGPGEKAPAEQADDTVLSQEELLRQPVHIEHRPKKDPRGIKILDPACGSGHFLLYAFDLLERIYEEAWGDPERPNFEATGRTLREEYETLDDLRRAVPRLIIEHNLHGIDIDPRAVQIAALAIWLRGQKAWKNFNLKATDGQQITKSHIIIAEPMPGDEEMRREFMAGLKPQVLGQLVDMVFEKMKLAGEAGSLLKIEEEIQDAIAAAKKQWLEGPKSEQQHLFPEMADLQLKQQEFHFDVEGVTDERFWEQAEDRILDALRKYAELAENSHTIRHRLFAEDAVRGFAFVDLCRKRYDVVLMNPPFGASPENLMDLRSDQYLEAILKNIAWGFIERAATFLLKSGLTGCIVDRTLYQKSSYEPFRRRFVSGRQLGVLVDMGVGVLDNAEVMTCCFTSSGTGFPSVSVFFDVRQESLDGKSEVLQEKNERFFRAQLDQTSYLHSVSDFIPVPFMSFSYWLSKSSIESAFGQRRIGTSHFDVGGGLQCNDVFRFVRIWPEVHPYSLAHSVFVPFYNGGPYSCFFIQNHQYVLWKNNGRDIKAKIIYQMGDHPTRYVANESMYFKGGIAGGKRGEFFDVHVLPKGAIFSNEGRAFQHADNQELWFLLSFLNTAYAQNLVNAFCGQHKGAGYLREVPVPEIHEKSYIQLHQIMDEIVNLKRTWLKKDETGIEFTSFIPSEIECSLINLSSISQYYGLALWEDDRRLQEFENSIRSIFIEALGEDHVSEYEASGWTESPRPVDSNTSLSETIANIDDPLGIATSILSNIVGFLFGRWDIRIAIDPPLASNLPDPLDPLPVCPPGMLVGSEGLPAESGQIVSEEWLRARPDANSLPPEGMVKIPVISDSEYPLRINWNGIMVDDPGFSGAQPHRDDIVRRVRDVLDLLWKDRAHEIEQEACDILGVKSLRAYFRKPSGFFRDHLKRYSKSRRKAPIYWPLSTASGSYTLWLYYHRLTDQIFFTCVNDYLDPKLKQVSEDVQKLKQKDERSREDERELEYQSDLELELRDFREELLRIAQFWKPNLNDGVQITAAPLWKLFMHKPWQKKLKDTWGKLEAGEYDWAHLAYSIWPDRVREKCKSDKSLAIAHDLENLFEE